MDIIIYIVSGFLLLVALLGCFLPVLPGPPIAFAGLLLMQLTDPAPFTSNFMYVMGAATLAVFLIDYVIPAYGTKRYGGGRGGVIGTFIGLFIGIFLFPPFGIIIGPLVGALVGELLSGKESKQAMRAAWGSFVGFLLGTMIKLILCLVMCYYYFVSLF